MTRSEINRQNAQKSTGPRTAEGKQKSSLNALRHGLTSHLPVIPGEDPELYQIHLQAFLDEYDPKSVTELHLTRSLADLAWRIDRIASMEANLLHTQRGADEILDTVTLVKTREVMMRSISNLSLHGHRMSRQFQKTRAELLEIQKQNKQENPAGFVFTDPVAQAPKLTEIPPSTENPTSSPHVNLETNDAMSPFSGTRQHAGGPACIETNHFHRACV